jgi:hypothetical protein
MTEEHMTPTLKSLLAAGGLAAALVASSAALADKWNMPVRSNERNYFTRNIMQFAEDVKKATDGKVEIVIHPAAIEEAVRVFRGREPRYERAEGPEAFIE